MNARKINMGSLALAVLLVATGLLIYLVLDLRKTEKSLAESLILKSNEYMSLELGRWFESAEQMSRMVVGQAHSGVFDKGDTDTYLNYFYHLLRQFQFVKYGAIVTQEDHEYTFYFDDDGVFTSREGWLSQWGSRAIYRTWEQEPAGNTWQLLSELEDSEYYDVSIQEWILAARANEPGYMSWTPPFKTRVGNQLLVALSSKWKQTGKEDDNILGLGILLTEISQYTRMQEVSPGGSVFILSGDGRYIGLPRHLFLKGDNDLGSKLLAHVDSVDISAPGRAWDIWNENGRVERAPFEFVTEHGKYWGSFDLFPLADGKKLIIGVTIPEKDILSELQRTKRIIIGSFIFILFLTSFLLYSYNQTRKANLLLDAKNMEIHRQKDIIEQRNRNITDSIVYARDLQTALFPTEDMMDEHLKEYFVFFRPKDVVAGDFYWMELVDDVLYFAAADCTGHGVPGALVSVICINALNYALHEEGLRDPGAILDKTRDQVIKDFSKSERSVNDGMDIALVAMEGNAVRFAGANNPLWIISRGALKEVKGDQQPIGNYADKRPFTTHRVEILPGDSIYLFSDGFVDQFGGERRRKLKFKPFREKLLAIQSMEMKEQGEELARYFDQWKRDYEQIDDVCVTGIRYTK